MADAFCELASANQLRAYAFGEFSIAYASWIDNIYVMDAAISAAVSRLELLEQVLRRRWRLQFKESSRMITHTDKVVEH